VVTRVFLVDDHEIVRVGIAELLSGADDLHVVGEAASVAEALTRIPAIGAPAQPRPCSIESRRPVGDCSWNRQASHTDWARTSRPTAVPQVALSPG
jgi:CheY-like chemotaxis protein